MKLVFHINENTIKQVRFTQFWFRINIIIAILANFLRCVRRIPKTVLFKKYWRSYCTNRIYYKTHMVQGLDLNKSCTIFEYILYKNKLFK